MILKKISSSACLIVKNEENQLPGCLESIKDIVDEIIIVDTGSTDRSIKIAKSFRAKVYEHQWENDFSKHRNQAIKYASGNWILNIDADERLILSNGMNKVKFIETLSKLPQDCNAIMLAMRDINQQGEIVTEFMNARLVRNTADFHFEGIIHENPIFKGVSITLNGITLNHHGYHLPQEEMDKKRERNTNLLLKRVEKNPKDVAAYFYLANHYAFVLQITPDGLQKALKYGKKCIQLLPPNPTKWPSAFWGLFRMISEIYYLVGDKNKAEKWCLKGLKLIPDDPDLLFLMPKLAIANLKFDQSLKHGYAYLQSLEKYRQQPQLARGRVLLNISHDSEMAVQYRILISYLNLGDIAKAEEQWLIVKKFISSTDQTKMEYLRNLSVAGDVDRLLERTILFYLSSTPKNKSLLNSLIDYAVGTGAFDQTVANLLARLPDNESPNEINCYIADRLTKKGYYEQAVILLNPLYNRDAVDNQIITRLALAYEKEGNNELARELYDSHVKDSAVGSDFIINSMNFYKNINDQNALQTAVSILIGRHEHSELEDDILLFMIEFYWTSARYDDFLSATMVLLPRHILYLPEKLQDNIGIAEGYSALSSCLFEKEKHNQALQALLIAWSISGDPKYLHLLGNLFSTLDQPVTALQYYQEALNRDYITPEILDRMEAAHLKIKNDSGAEICRQMKKRFFNSVAEK